MAKNIWGIRPSVTFLTEFTIQKCIVFWTSENGLILIVLKQSSVVPVYERTKNWNEAHREENVLEETVEEKEMVKWDIKSWWEKEQRWGRQEWIRGKRSGERRSHCAVAKHVTVMLEKISKQLRGKWDRSGAVRLTNPIYWDFITHRS